MNYAEFMVLCEYYGVQKLADLAGFSPRTLKKWKANGYPEEIIKYKKLEAKWDEMAKYIDPLGTKRLSPHLVKALPFIIEERAITQARSQALERRRTKKSIQEAAAKKRRAKAKKAKQAQRLTQTQILIEKLRKDQNLSKLLD